MPHRSGNSPADSSPPRTSRRGAVEPPSDSSPSRFSFFLSRNRQRDIVGLAMIALGLLTLLSLFGFAGSITALWATLLTKFVGWGAFVLAGALVIAGALLLRRQENVFDEDQVPWGRIVGLEIIFAAGCGLTSLAMAGNDLEAQQLAENGQAGGYLGLAIASILTRFFGNFVDAAWASAFASIVLCLVILLALRLAFDLRGVSAFLIRSLEALRPAPAQGSVPTGAARSVPSQRIDVAPNASPYGPPVQLPLPPDEAGDLDAAGVGTAAPRAAEKSPSPVVKSGLFGLGLAQAKTKPKPTLPLPAELDPLLAVPRKKMFARTGHLPSLDLLESSPEAQYAQASAEQKARIIEETLAQFGIPAKVLEYKAGPTITQFAVEPGFVERRGLDGSVQRRKVPVNRIISLANDLSLALASSPIRIEAPVPGRNYVGIEVPNESIGLVSLRGVLESDAFKKLRQKATLPIALGRDVSGAAVVADLGAMPHLLIAGATGSGKSVAINAIISCLLFSYSPDELRMVMIDPKRVELVNYNGIPHLLGEVITDVSHVVPALRWATNLMDARFQAFSKARTRNIEVYNQKMDKEGGNRLPYVVIIIDELADLMLSSPDETERLITRLAQMARATGLHLILATQRPSVDVVTGLIKANFPARISFAVTSSVDSRVVLDSPGAEKLLGRGDMLYMAPDSAKLQRLQGCFVSDEELGRLTNHWRKLQETFDYQIKAPWGSAAHGQKEADRGGDDLADAAIEVIRKNNQASISLLQRKLGIGYPRAARLMDQLEEMGVVGPDEGTGKPRAILLQESSKRGKK